MEKLKELMKNNHNTQDEVAKYLGVSRASIYKYLQGKAEPNIQALIKLSNFYNVSLDYLCGHQNQNLLFIDDLNLQKKELIGMIKTMSDDQVLRMLGYAANITEDIKR